MARIISATAPFTRVERLQPTEYSVIDDNTGRKIMHASVIRGFIHLAGASADFKGFSAVLASRGSEHPATISQALAEGVRNGRDDRS